jgi:hypothetical protein
MTIRMRSRTVLILVIAALSLTRVPTHAADTLAAQIPDAAYWKLITDLSEPDGYYQYTVITSNETAYQEVLPQLTKSIAPGGTYLGVGPEQNFTYIAALRPKVAFIIDIRRDMMIEHLMYKAVFEMSVDRAEFVGNLFSRKKPALLAGEPSVGTLFQTYAAVKGDPELLEANLREIVRRLKVVHGFAMTGDDERRLRTIYTIFFREGVVNFNSSIESPGYTALMIATDGRGRNWSFLASKENFDRVREMQQKNLIVPLTGDFGGPKTIRAVGQYIRDHGAIVNLFYLSNVEDYLQNVVAGYSRNIASLPVDSTSSFIHVSLAQNGFRPWITPISEFVRPRDIR